MLSIHNNLSAGAQNVTDAYVIITLVYRRLLTTRLVAKQLCDSKLYLKNSKSYLSKAIISKFTVIRYSATVTIIILHASQVLCVT